MQPQPAKDNGVRDGRSNLLDVTPHILQDNAKALWSSRPVSEAREVNLLDVTPHNLQGNAKACVVPGLYLRLVR